jgi:DNA transformation protein
MANDSGFIEHLRELLEPIPGVTIKKMFGGYGIFRTELMFALIADDTLYFKADDQNRSEFEAKALKPWVYHNKDGKAMTMPYYQAPEETLDNSDDMCVWAESAYQAALRTQKPKKKTTKTKKQR